LKELEDLLSLAGSQCVRSDTSTVVVERSSEPLGISLDVEMLTVILDVSVEHANHDVWKSTIASEAGHRKSLFAFDAECSLMLTLRSSNTGYYGYI
jgi:hypothetical protein